MQLSREPGGDEGGGGGVEGGEGNLGGGVDELGVGEAGVGDVGLGFRVGVFDGGGEEAGCLGRLFCVVSREYGLKYKKARSWEERGGCEGGRKRT